LACPAWADLNPSISGMAVNGSAQIINVAGHPILALTKAQQNVTGSAFTMQRLQFGPKFRFSTFFQIQMSNPGGICAADGMTFTI